MWIKIVCITTPTENSTEWPSQSHSWCQNAEKVGNGVENKTQSEDCPVFWYELLQAQMDTQHFSCATTGSLWQRKRPKFSSQTKWCTILKLYLKKDVYVYFLYTVSVSSILQYMDKICDYSSFSKDIDQFFVLAWCNHSLKIASNVHINSIQILQ